MLQDSNKSEVTFQANKIFFPMIRHKQKKQTQTYIHSLNKTTNILKQHYKKQQIYTQTL